MAAGRRWASSLVALVVALGWLVGCGGGSDEGSASPSDKQVTAATDPSGLRQPGAEIADGVHVQPGSALVGAAFPSLAIDAGESAPTGWEAVIAVEGDPIDVWDAYAAELGIEDQAGARQACIVQAERKRDESGEASARQRFLTDEALDHEMRLWCHARIGTTEVSLASGMVGCVRPNMSDDPCDPRSGSSMLIRRSRDGGGDDALGTDDLRVDRAYAELPAEPEGDGRGEPVQLEPLVEAGDPAPSTTRAPQPPDPHPSPVEIPDGPIIRPELADVGPSNLPGPGDRIDDGIDSYLGTSDEDWVAEAAILPAGAESLIAPSMLIACNSGLVAVVAMPKEPADAVGAFAVEDPEGTTGVVTGQLGARSWATRFFDSAGGYKLQLTAVAGDEDGTSYVLATECGD